MVHLSAVKVSEVLLGVLAAVQGVATLAIDLTRTHATNPDWPGHARFHVVWQSANVLLLTVLAECVLYSHALPEGVGFHLALILTAVPMIGFLGALVSRAAYAGTLRDRIGVPPLVLQIQGKRREFDMNSMAVYAGLFVCSVLWCLHDVWR